MDIVAASGGRDRARTVGRVRINGAHIDQRRLLLPAAYAKNSADFGVVRALEFGVPDGGDVVSMRVALEQHLVVCSWFGNGQRPTAAVLCKRFEMSTATFSRTVRGQRWAGETLLAAFSYALRSAPPGR